MVGSLSPSHIYNVTRQGTSVKKKVKVFFGFSAGVFPAPLTSIM